MLKKDTHAIRSKTMKPFPPCARPRKPNVIASAISVNAVGKPIMIVMTSSSSMTRPRASGLMV